MVRTRDRDSEGQKPTRCLECGKASFEISQRIGLCKDCLCQNFLKYRPRLHEIHAAGRVPFGLPAEVPHHGNKTCRLCANRCSPREGELGFCGLRRVQDGKLKSRSGTGRKGCLDWYYDSLPTNCCADFVCPAGSRCPEGWQAYAYAEGPEYGYKNLAVFYRSCSMGCLYCQNWHYRLGSADEGITPEEVAAAVDERTACVCFFGGDPSTQAVHAIRTAEHCMRAAQGRILRICFETNGRWDPVLLRRASRLSCASGGCIKFDLKAWTYEVHAALTGFPPNRTRENFECLVPEYKARPEPPLLVACTLLVPGYVDEIEVGSIAHWLVSLDPTIPYRLLVFHPQFHMDDLPVTSRVQMERCLEAAKTAGLERVSIGNLHLLRD